MNALWILKFNIFFASENLSNFTRWYNDEVGHQSGFELLQTLILMKLYKYIKFEKNNYWSEPLKNRTLFFAPVEKLRGVNDSNEFNFDWTTLSYFFINDAMDLPPLYADLFKKARILCLSEHLKKSCWDQFCKDGGVCYEFEFNTELSVDINHGQVKYVDDKIYNVPDFIIKNVSCDRIKTLLRCKIKHTREEKFELLKWLNTKEPNRIVIDHIEKELTFKKISSYNDEGEFRFIHLSEPVPGQTLKIKLKNCRAKFNEFGLSLKCAYTSDVALVEKTNSVKNLPIHPLPF